MVRDCYGMAGEARSPSSWRAWIEIVRFCNLMLIASVALLVEGVDRNLCHSFELCKNVRSPSSWRAWIEMYGNEPDIDTLSVALLVEGVDRNIMASFATF